MQKRLILIIVVLMGAFLFYFSCEEKGTKPPTARELINQGWQKFQAGNLVGAESDFTAALSISTIKIDSSDALLGLGWGQLRQDHGGLAENSFVKHLSLAPRGNDGRAGLAFAYSTTSKFREAIDTANLVLSSDPTWAFVRDNSINSNDLHLLLAQCYYFIAIFDSSLTEVRGYYDPNFWVDVNTHAGRDTLGMKIEEWGP